MSELKKDFTIWASDNKKDYFAAKSTYKELPAGYYNIRYNDDNGFYLSKQKLEIEDYIELPSSKISEIKKDIEGFLSKKELYDKMKFNRKMGIIIHGPPGNGKLTTVKQIAKDFIEKGNIVINSDEPEDLCSFISIIRSIENGRNIMVIIDKIDFMADKYGHHVMMDLMDTLNNTDNIIYLATINKIEIIHELLYNKPNGFDIIFKVDNPSIEDKKSFLTEKLKNVKVNGRKVNFQKWIKDTKEFSLAHLKKLVINVVISGEQYKSALDRIKKEIEKLSPSDNDDKYTIGF